MEDEEESHPSLQRGLLHMDFIFHSILVPVAVYDILRPSFLCHPFRPVRVTMLSVGGSSRIFSLPIRGFCSAVIYRKSLPPVITSSPGNYLHRSGGGAHVSGVRALSGGSSDAAAGWYSSLADSTPVHLCEQLLVSVQEVSGLPWWFSICVATLSVRTLVTLPLAAYQLVVISKVSDAGLHI